MVSDVVGTARFPDELSSARWQRRAEPQRVRVGDTFCSDDTSGNLRWRCCSVVTEAHPSQRFAFAVGGAEQPTATWAFDLRPEPAGTEVVYQVALGDGPSMLDRVSGGDPDRRSDAEQRRLDRFAELMARMLADLGRRVAEPGSVATVSVTATRVEAAPAPAWC